MNNLIKIIVVSIFLISNLGGQTVHPNLVLTNSDVKLIKESLGTAPLFDRTYNKTKAKVDEALTQQIVVPIPKDAGGGFTHEKHKQNYNEMYQAGILFQVTGEDKYAKFIKD
jgi:type III secretory pathway component EscR